MGKDRNEFAAAKKSTGKREDYRMTWVTFQEHDIGAKYFVSGQTVEEPVDRLLELCESNWKISLSYSDAYGGFIGSATCRDKDSVYYKRVFLVSHVDGCKAVRAIAYVLHTMLPRGDFLGGDTLKASTW